MQSYLFADVVESAGERLINTSVLGALVVLLIAAIVWLTKKWSDTQEKRVAEQQEMTKTVTALVNEFREAVRDMTTTVSGLKVSSESQTAVLDKLESTIDSVVRDAVRGSTYKALPPHGGPRA